MYRILYAAMTILWILDICNINVSGLEFLLNDSNGLNTTFWFLVWVFIPGCSISTRERGD